MPGSAGMPRPAPAALYNQAQGPDSQPGTGLGKLYGTPASAAKPPAGTQPRPVSGAGRSSILGRQQQDRQQQGPNRYSGGGQAAAGSRQQAAGPSRQQQAQQRQAAGQKQQSYEDFYKEKVGRLARCCSFVLLLLAGLALGTSCLLRCALLCSHCAVGRLARRYSMALLLLIASSRHVACATCSLHSCSTLPMQLPAGTSRLRHCCPTIHAPYMPGGPLTHMWPSVPVPHLTPRALPPLHTTQAPDKVRQHAWHKSPFVSRFRSFGRQSAQRSTQRPTEGAPSAPSYTTPAAPPPRTTIDLSYPTVARVPLPGSSVLHATDPQTQQKQQDYSRRVQEADEATARSNATGTAARGVLDKVRQQMASLGMHAPAEEQEQQAAALQEAPHRALAAVGQGLQKELQAGQQRAQRAQQQLQEQELKRQQAAAAAARAKPAAQAAAAAESEVVEIMDSDEEEVRCTAPPAVCCCMLALHNACCRQASCSANRSPVKHPPMLSLHAACCRPLLINPNGTLTAARCLPSPAGRVRGPGGGRVRGG